MANDDAELDGVQGSVLGNERITGIELGGGGETELAGIAATVEIVRKEGATGMRRVQQTGPTTQIGYCIRVTLSSSSSAAGAAKESVV